MNIYMKKQQKKIRITETNQKEVINYDNTND